MTPIYWCGPSTRGSAATSRCWELVNDAELDWPNIAEEVESVGRSQLSRVKLLLRRALIHMLKAEAWPLSPEVPHWRAGARRFRDDAAEAFSLWIRDRIDVPALYVKALRATPATIDGHPPLPMPETCPVTLDELLGDGF